MTGAHFVAFVDNRVRALCLRHGIPYPPPDYRAWLSRAPRISSSPRPRVSASAQEQGGPR